MIERKSSKKVAKVPLLGPFIVGKVGYRKAIHVIGFIAAWGLASDQHQGGPLTIEEFAPIYGKSLSQTYRHLALFREVWPKDRDPLRVWLWCQSQVELSDEREMAAAELWGTGGIV